MIVSLLVVGGLAVAGGALVHANSAPEPAITTAADGTDSRYWLNGIEPARSLA